MELMRYKAFALVTQSASAFLSFKSSPLWNIVCACMYIAEYRLEILFQFLDCLLLMFYLHSMASSFSKPCVKALYSLYIDLALFLWEFFGRFVSCLAFLWTEEYPQGFLVSGSGDSTVSIVIKVLKGGIRS